MKMTITAAGDSILMREYPAEGYEGLSEIQKYLARGQARFNNLEMCLTDWDQYGSQYCGGCWLSNTPAIFPRLLNYGFNFFGFSNNHTLDYGPGGLLETLDHVRKYDVSITGAGKNMEEASRAVFRSFPGGRVAFIAISSSFNEAARAGYSSHTLPGRPGLNALGVTTYYSVNREHFEALKAIADATAINGHTDISRRNGFQPPLPDDQFEFGGIRFCLSRDGTERKYTSCNKRDLERTLKTVRDAKRVADYVVIMLHSHQIKGKQMNVPDYFAEEFAHACIDAGADAIFGGGTHELKPVEIYHGKPVFYSLGNFCFQLESVEHMPYDQIEKYAAPGASDREAIFAQQKNFTFGLTTQFFNYRSVLPYLEFEDGKLVALEAKPLELGFDLPISGRGIPYPANKKVSQEICEALTALSAPYGTKMHLEDGVIRFELGKE